MKKAYLIRWTWAAICILKKSIQYEIHDLTTKYSGAQSSWSNTGTKQLWQQLAVRCQSISIFSQLRSVPHILFGRHSCSVWFQECKAKQTNALKLRALKRPLTEPYPVLIVWELTDLAQLACYRANSFWHNNDQWASKNIPPHRYSFSDDWHFERFQNSRFGSW